ncbi:MAG: hypothetical protein QOH12_585 [Solirubrobacteraceae bacterium]|jgi:hypothetical protein|nr:hypothetical protein [Solirubrobacteraceae bacterium]
MTQLHRMVAYERHQDLVRAAAQSAAIAAARDIIQPKPTRRHRLRRSPLPPVPPLEHAARIAASPCSRVL